MSEFGRSNESILPSMGQRIAEDIEVMTKFGTFSDPELIQDVSEIGQYQPVRVYGGKLHTNDGSMQNFYFLFVDTGAQHWGTLRASFFELAMVTAGNGDVNTGIQNIKELAKDIDPTDHSPFDKIYLLSSYGPEQSE
jgi:hypothetical protein